MMLCRFFLRRQTSRFILSGPLRESTLCLRHSSRPSVRSSGTVSDRRRSRSCSADTSSFSKSEEEEYEIGKKLMTSALLIGGAVVAVVEVAEDEKKVVRAVEKLTGQRVKISKVQSSPDGKRITLVRGIDDEDDDDDYEQRDSNEPSSGAEIKEDSEDEIKTNSTPDPSTKETSANQEPPSSSSEDSEDEEKEDTEEPLPTQEKPKKKKVGFKERNTIEYENRIRNFSEPIKIFRYFATYKAINTSEIFMTPEDFLRSLTPGVLQPEGLGLDQFRKFDPNVGIPFNDEDKSGLGPDCIFRKLGNSGLISFSDYIFLLTILSTSRRQFEIAFRMFDLNGDGDVDASEFSKIRSIIFQTTSVGNRHRDRELHHSGHSVSDINSALAVYFFGSNLENKLTIEKFLEFQTELQREILTLEFERKEPDEEGFITEKQFAELLLTYADYQPTKMSTTLKRVKKRYRDPAEGVRRGVSLEEYVSVFKVLMHIEDVDKALCFYNLAGASISPETLKHVAKICADVELGDHLVDVIFTIFDEDGDGELSNKEFVSVMKNKLNRGLEKPKDTGVLNFLHAITNCAKATFSLDSAARKFQHHN